MGWIPFKSSAIKLFVDKDKKNNAEVSYQKKKYKIYYHRPLPDNAIIKTGSFNQDSQGRWFINIVFDTKDSIASHPNMGKSIGIDFGIKELMTLSDGQIVHRPNYTKRYEQDLAAAQRAVNKKKVRKIHTKIKNCRKDFLHKETAKIVKQYGNIAIGNVSSQDIIDKGLNSNMNKAVYDSGWYF